MSKSSSEKALVASLILAACSGCSDPFPLAKATGMVVCEGEPVAGAFVYFEPAGGTDRVSVGKGAFARTDAAGRFVLSTHTDGDGAVIGEHRVRVGRGTATCDCQFDENKDLQLVKVGEKENHFTLELKKLDRRIRVRKSEEEREVD